MDSEWTAAIREFLPDDVRREFSHIYPTGSYFICTPPVKDTDIDFVVYNNDPFQLPEVVGRLINSGWSPPAEESRSSNSYGFIDKGFLSLKKGNINLIVSHSADHYARYVLATILAKRFNLLKKEDRIALFHAVIYTEFPEGETSGL